MVDCGIDRAPVCRGRGGGPRGSSPLPDTVADQVMAYLTAARWFAGKGRLVTLRSLTPLPWLNETAEFFAESAPAVRLEIAEVAYAVEQDPDDQPAAEDPAWAGGPRQPVTPDANGPREFYQLALSYRRARAPDLHFAEVARGSSIPSWGRWWPTTPPATRRPAGFCCRPWWTRPG